ncbi:glycosyltransferase family 4 protein [Listeria rustica]|uniref:Glycosyltransferase family 4 protein n=1 Tax=Listeria rustica TaxID=2713503 RepID=A0A7W1YFG1_9LIST|nr:glycosyltransferase family 4 protein [Listeria rustica]MBA3925607.1 glycosyltransferase family 4 protein [Listeria rustica]
MKIVYLHQYFNKDKGSTRSYEIAKHLVSEGHEVTMITGSDVESCDGIKIISTKTSYNQDFGYLKRIFSFLSFMMKSFIYALREKDVDIVYATSTPLTVGLVGKWVARFKRTKLVFEVRDVWPDVPIKLGIIQNKWMIRMLYRMEKSIYKKASTIIALSEGMKDDIVAKGIASEKIEVITNFADVNAFAEITEDEKAAIYAKYPRLEGQFVCLYAGTLGYVNHVEYVLEIARLTKAKHISFVIVGDGKEKAKLVQQAEAYGLRNVQFVDGVSKREAMAWMAVSDMGMCFVRDAEVLDRNSQNKLFDFWAAGKQTLINYHGWQDRVLQKHAAGQGFEYSEKARMAAHVEAMSLNEEICDKVSTNISLLAKKYQKETQIAQLEVHLKNVLGETVV